MNTRTVGFYISCQTFRVEDSLAFKRENVVALLHDWAFNFNYRRKKRTTSHGLSLLDCLRCSPFTMKRIVSSKERGSVNIGTALDKIYRSHVNTFEHVHPKYRRFEFLLEWFRLQGSKLWILYCVHPTLVGGLICVNTIHKKINLFFCKNMHVYILSKYDYFHDTGYT